MRIICDVFRRDQQPETAGIRLAIPTRDGSKFCVVRRQIEFTRDGLI